MLTDLHVGSMVMLLVHPIFNADWWLILQNGGDKGRPKEAILVPGTSQVAVRASERVARRAVGAPAHSQDERDRGGLVRAGTQLLSGILWAQKQTQQVGHAPIPSAVGIIVSETTSPCRPQVGSWAGVCASASLAVHGVQAVTDPSVERQRRGGRYLLKTGTFLTDFSSRW